MFKYGLEAECHDAVIKGKDGKGHIDFYLAKYVTFKLIERDPFIKPIEILNFIWKHYYPGEITRFLNNATKHYGDRGEVERNYIKYFFQRIGRPIFQEIVVRNLVNSCLMFWFEIPSSKEDRNSKIDGTVLHLKDSNISIPLQIKNHRHMDSKDQKEKQEQIKRYGRPAEYLEVHFFNDDMVNGELYWIEGDIKVLFTNRGLDKTSIQSFETKILKEMAKKAENQFTFSKAQI